MICLCRRVRTRRGYTLLEVLVTCAILGVAAALMIPSLDQTGVLRIQAGVRAIVSDITYAQSDALVYQRRRAVLFFEEAQDPVPSNTYVLAEVNGETIDPTNDAMFSQEGPNQRYWVMLGRSRFADIRILDVDFDGTSRLIFDEMGGPVLTTTGNAPSNGGYVRVTGQGGTFDINVEAFTGRVTVERVDQATP